MTSLLSRRSSSFVGLCFCLGLLAAALVLQTHYKLVPCPLCMLQRYITCGIAFGFFIGSVTKKIRWFRTAHIIVLPLTALGIAVSCRHLWLQSLPPESVPACGPDLDFMLRHMPFNETLKLLYQGSGDCAHVDWRFLQLSLPAWTLISYITIAIYSIVTRVLYGRRDVV